MECMPATVSAERPCEYEPTSKLLQKLGTPSRHNRPFAQRGSRLSPPAAYGAYLHASLQQYEEYANR